MEELCVSQRVAISVLAFKALALAVDITAIVYGVEAVPSCAIPHTDAIQISFSYNGLWNHSLRIAFASNSKQKKDVIFRDGSSSTVQHDVKCQLFC